MSEEDLRRLMERKGVTAWRIALARRMESKAVQGWITAVIVVNALIMGLETDAGMMERMGGLLHLLDSICLGIFIVEIGLKLAAYRWHFWRNGWNIFDFLVVAVALVPGAGAWSVLRSLRVLRILRLLTVLPQLRRVVAAFIHALPGLSGVLLVMLIFFYTAGILATNLFGETHPQWFGTLGASLFSLFQIMTLESWSMGIVRPVMEVHSLAWLFFVPFIILATFTILNLFIGIIVSTMQELSIPPTRESGRTAEVEANLRELEQTVQRLRQQLDRPE
jgi:voltage-gated sodium channel